jgi:hypothetical protein
MRNCGRWLSSPSRRATKALVSHEKPALRERPVAKRPRMEKQSCCLDVHVPLVYAYLADSLWQLLRERRQKAHGRPWQGTDGSVPDATASSLRRHACAPQGSRLIASLCADAEARR